MDRILQFCKVKIEICASSVEALVGAAQLKVDRVEVCSCLELGGVSPSVGLIQKSLDLGLETHVLVRPRSGGFVFSSFEVDLMLSELAFLQKLGVHGAVLGALNSNLSIDRATIKEARSIFRGQLTFHRAFDDLVEWRKEMDALVELGVHRILSSGLATSVTNGIPTLAEMVLHAKGSIEIMAGGGVNMANLKTIASEVKPDAVHFSATTKEMLDPSSFFSEERLVFDVNKAIKLVELCRNYR
ncbi:MAG: hypothetical protein RL432_1439 [Bacteroidota bacterium]|jgi:copper homeostasis protein